MGKLLLKSSSGAASNKHRHNHSNVDVDNNPILSSSSSLSSINVLPENTIVKPNKYQCYSEGSIRNGAVVHTFLPSKQSSSLLSYDATNDIKYHDTPVRRPNDGTIKYNKHKTTQLSTSTANSQSSLQKILTQTSLDTSLSQPSSSADSDKLRNEFTSNLSSLQLRKINYLSQQTFKHSQSSVKKHPEMYANVPVVSDVNIVKMNLLTSKGCRRVEKCVELINDRFSKSTRYNPQHNLLLLYESSNNNQSSDNTCTVVIHKKKLRLLPVRCERIKIEEDALIRKLSKESNVSSMTDDSQYTECTPQDNKTNILTKFQRKRSGNSRKSVKDCDKSTVNISKQPKDVSGRNRDHDRERDVKYTLSQMDFTSSEESLMKKSSLKRSKSLDFSRSNESLMILVKKPTQTPVNNDNKSVECQPLPSRELLSSTGNINVKSLPVKQQEEAVEKSNFNSPEEKIFQEPLCKTQKLSESSSATDEQLESMLSLMTNNSTDTNDLMDDSELKIASDHDDHAHVICDGNINLKLNYHTKNDADESGLLLEYNKTVKKRKPQVKFTNDETLTSPKIKRKKIDVMKTNKIDGKKTYINASTNHARDDYYNDILKESKTHSQIAKKPCNDVAINTKRKLPSMPAIDPYNIDIDRSTIYNKANLTIKDEVDHSSISGTLNSMSLFTIGGCATMNNNNTDTLPSQEHDRRKKAPEIIDERILPVGSVSIISRTVNDNDKKRLSVKQRLGIRKEFPNSKTNEKDEKSKLSDLEDLRNQRLLRSFNTWANIPELSKLISPSPSVNSSLCETKPNVQNSGELPINQPSNATAKKNRQPIVYTTEDKTDNKPINPLTVENVTTFTASTRVRNTQNQKRIIQEICNEYDDKRGVTKRYRRSWKLDSSDACDSITTSDSPILNYLLSYDQGDETDNSLPKFGKSLSSARTQSVSDDSIENRMLAWINKDNNVNDNVGNVDKESRFNESNSNYSDTTLRASTSHSRGNSLDSVKLTVSTSRTSLTDDKVTTPNESQFTCNKTATNSPHASTDSIIMQLNELINNVDSLDIPNVTRTDLEHPVGIADYFDRDNLSNNELPINNENITSTQISSLKDTPESVKKSHVDVDNPEQIQVGESVENIDQIETVDKKDNDSIFIMNSEDDKGFDVKQDNDNDSSHSSSSDSDSSSSSSSSSSSQSTASVYSLNSNARKSSGFIELTQSLSRSNLSDTSVCDQTEKNKIDNYNNDFAKDDDENNSILSIDSINNTHSGDLVIDDDEVLDIASCSWNNKASNVNNLMIIENENSNDIENNCKSSKNNDKEKGVKEEEEMQEDDDAISLYAESLDGELQELDEMRIFSPVDIIESKPSSPISPAVSSNPVQCDAIENYCQFTQNQFNNDYMEMSNANSNNDDKNNNSIRTLRVPATRNCQNSGQVNNLQNNNYNNSGITSPNSENHSYNFNNNIMSMNNFNNAIPMHKLIPNFVPVQRNSHNVYDPAVGNDNRYEYVKSHFFGNCFKHLKTGECGRENCTFNHELTKKIRYIYMDSITEINAVLIYAFKQKFYNYLRIVYYAAVIKLNVDDILKFFPIIFMVSVPMLIDDYLKWTIDALMTKKHTLKFIINYLAKELTKFSYLIDPPISPSSLKVKIINCVIDRTNPGNLWNTFRSLLLTDISPSSETVSLVLQECIEHKKSYLHIKDILDNLFANVPDYVFANVDQQLLKYFMDFATEQRIKYDELLLQQQPKIITASDIQAAVTSKSDDINAIESPDKLNNSQSTGSSSKDIQIDGICDPRKAQQQYKVVTGVINEKKSLSIQDRLGVRSNVDTTLEPSTSDVQRIDEPVINNYKLIPIDIDQPQSRYTHYIWQLRMDFDLIEDSIEKRNYDQIIRILYNNKHDKSQPFIREFYRLLCNKLMSSVEHFKEVLQRTVKYGLYVKLHKLLVDTGFNLLITLTENQLWLLAYNLLQLLHRYFINNTDSDKLSIEFIFISVEIYLANNKPRKAFHLIKRYNLMVSDIKQWKTSSSNKIQDLDIQKQLIKILITSLAYFYPEYAFELFKETVQNQKNSFKPSDLTNTTTDILKRLLDNNNDVDDILIEMADMILKYNLIVSNKILRRTINKIFHNDVILSRRLFNYASEIGVYTRIRYFPHTSAILTIDTNLTEEEMFLIISESLDILKKQMGSKINKIKPRRFSFFLNFEIVPSEQMLYHDDCHSNKGNIAKVSAAKKLIREVFQKFDPMLKMTSRRQGDRVCKMINHTVFSHLRDEYVE